MKTFLISLLITLSIAALVYSATQNVEKYKAQTDGSIYVNVKGKQVYIGDLRSMSTTDTTVILTIDTKD